MTPTAPATSRRGQERERSLGILYEWRQEERGWWKEVTGGGQELVTEEQRVEKRR